MNCKSEDLRLYAITDRHWLNGETLYQQVEKALKGGVTFLQLREKNLDEEDFMKEARKIKALCKKYKVPLIINDNVEIAREIDADGVHVGQSDMEAGDVRDRLGPDKIIGVSTSTKSDAKNVSHETLKEICKAVRIPVVAIGGITRDNVKELTGCGADGIAVISAVFAQQDIESAARELKKCSEEMVKG